VAETRLTEFVVGEAQVGLNLLTVGKRNADRFPQGDFRFQLTRDETIHLISQFAISSGENLARRAEARSRN